MSRDISLHKTSLYGDRPSNEDVEKYNMNLLVDGNALDSRYSPVDFFLVCDGHGGREVADFVAPLLEKHLMKKGLEYPLTQNYINTIYSHIQNKVIEHPKKIGKECGSTALVVIRYLKNSHKYLQVINLGDCRSILSRKGLAIPLSKDHKPFWPDEKHRIHNVNKKHGTKEKIRFDFGDWRIGDLSVSRSFGDLDNAPYISHIPDSFNYQLQNDDEFVVLVCDGITDIFQNHEIVNFIRDHMVDNHIELYNIPKFYPRDEIRNQINIARKLAEYAIAIGLEGDIKMDNLSVLIVFFKAY